MKGRGFAHRQTKAAAGLAACLLLAGSPQPVLHSIWAVFAAVAAFEVG